MKINQILGDNPALRFENIGYIKKKTQKWGIVFGGAYALMMILVCMGLSKATNITASKIILTCIVAVASVVIAYWAGKAYGWGWYWFKLKHGNFGEVVGQSLDDALFYSFFIGSKSFLITLIMLGIFVAIGFYIGLYCMIRYEWKEYKQLRKGMA